MENTKMKVKELIRRLKLCDPNSSMIFYYLKDANLLNCEYETLLGFDQGGAEDKEGNDLGRVELTIKEENSNENGNMENEE